MAARLGMVPESRHPFSPPTCNPRWEKYLAKEAKEGRAPEQ